MEVIRTQVRIPKVIADWIKLEAKRDNRSMNAKLVQILVESRAAQLGIKPEQEKDHAK